MARCESGPIARLFALSSCLGAFAGCERNVHAHDPCRLNEAHVIARAPELAFDAVDLARTEQGAILAAWSLPQGLFTRLLAADGKPSSEQVAIGERCRGGVSLAARPGGAWLACSRPNPVEEESELVLYPLDVSGRAGEPTALGRVGRDGKGVVVHARGDEALVVFHDGHVGAYGVRLSRVKNGSVRSELLSRPTVSADEPAMSLVNGRFTILFAETEFNSLTESETRIVALAEGKEPRVIREVNVSDPAPALAYDGHSLVLTFRALPERESKPELYAARLSKELRVIGEARRIGRANGDGAPSVLACDGHDFALLPREYATERYIAVHALDAALENRGNGHHFYMTERDFVLSRGTCSNADVLLLAAERAKVSEPQVSLMGMTFTCERESVDRTSAR